MKNRKVNKDVLVNLLLAVASMLYFIIINFSYYRVEDYIFLIGLKVLSGILLILGIVFIEVAYNKDNSKLVLNAIEIFVFSGHTISIQHVITVSNFQFSNYILISSYLISLYFVLKAVLIAAKDKREYLKNLSDIREIVDIKPTKKNAEKRKESK